MRKIEQALCKAIKSNQPFRSGNTVYQPAQGHVRLHGHLIAWKQGDGWQFSLCGWNTRTTRSRINAVISLVGGNRVCSHKGEPCQWDIAADGKTVYFPIDSNDWFPASVQCRDLASAVAAHGAASATYANGRLVSINA